MEDQSFWDNKFRRISLVLHWTFSAKSLPSWLGRIALSLKCFTLNSKLFKKLCQGNFSPNEISRYIGPIHCKCRRRSRMSTSGNPILASFQADLKKKKLLVGFSWVLFPAPRPGYVIPWNIRWKKIFVYSSSTGTDTCMCQYVYKFSWQCVRMSDYTHTLTVICKILSHSLLLILFSFRNSL